MKLLEPQIDERMALILNSLMREVRHGYTRRLAWVNKNNEAMWYRDIDSDTTIYNQHIKVINYLLYLSTKE